MAFKTCSHVGRSTPAGLAGRATSQQAKLLIDETIRDLDRKLKRVLDLRTKNQIAFQGDVKAIPDRITDRLAKVEKWIVS